MIIMSDASLRSAGHCGVETLRQNRKAHCRDGVNGNDNENRKQEIKEYGKSENIEAAIGQ